MEHIEGMPSDIVEWDQRNENKTREKLEYDAEIGQQRIIRNGIN